MVRVLVVDDSPTETFKISSVLNKHGYDVLIAESGEQGVSIAKKELPDVVLMDIVMPGLNGFQATQLKAHPAPHRALLRGGTRARRRAEDLYRGSPVGGRRRHSNRGSHLHQRRPRYNGSAR